MPRHLPVLLLAATTLAIASLAAAQQPPAPAEADTDRDCTAPMADWQPRKALQDKLTADGWTVLRIMIDDGCYEVDARDPSGAEVEAEFDPVTFELLDLDTDG